MMKILVAGPYPPPTHGFAVMTERLSEWLGDHLEGVQRVNLSSDLQNPQLRQLVQAYRALGAMARILGSRPKTIVSVGCNSGAGQVWTGLILITARLMRRKATLHHHTYRYIDSPTRAMRFLCWLGGPGMIHVFLAPAMAEAFRCVYPTGQAYEVVRNALFVPHVPERPTREGGPLVVGLLSNLSREKGLHDFVETARRMAAENIAVEMQLAGPIASAEDRQMVEAAVQDGLLTWLGPLHGAEKNAFFARLDLFLFPTRYRLEAQPTVIYEAFAAGVSTLSFDRGAIADQVGDLFAALPQDADFAGEAMALCRRMAAMDVSQRKRLRAACRERHAEHAAASVSALRHLFVEPYEGAA